jgi:3-deoxy-D-manno-octulosonic-acid transferase
LWLAFPVLVIYVLLRCWRQPSYRRDFFHRLGFLPNNNSPTPPGGIWLHAVSVGEVLGVQPLIQQWRQQHPGIPIWLTCSTVMGKQVAHQKLADIVDGIAYAPLDYAFCVRRFLRHWKPRVLVVTETEIWPNLWRETRRAGLGLVVVNGRISDQTAARYQRFAWFFRSVFDLPNHLLVQSKTDAERYFSLPNVEVAGNFKWDFSASDQKIAPGLTSWLESKSGPIWIAASTIAAVKPEESDEEPLVLDAYRQLRDQFPTLRLILAPRKPERFSLIAKLLTDAGFAFVRRSQLTLDSEKPAPSSDILLLDSVGELAGLMRVAQSVFVGGSLASHGGHNILESIAFQIPTSTGPNMQNFREIYQTMSRANAIDTVDGASRLAEVTAAHLHDAAKRPSGGPASEKALRAWEIMQNNRGATKRSLLAIESAYQAALPSGVLGGLRWLLPLSWLWQAGSFAKRRRDLSGQKRLPKPVISIGNLTVGGTGKTPVTLALIQQLHKSGLKVAVLTRGYRRNSNQVLALAPGSVVPVEETGDEAQLYLKQGLAWVGIDSDRHAAGLALLKEYDSEKKPLDQSEIDLFLLDDGFQHFRLHRDLDLVLLDVNDPFGGGACIPAGRLRELPAALGRAQAVLWTRAVPEFQYLKIHNQTYQADDQLDLPAAAVGPYAAFCGLANPDSFAASLRARGISLEWMQTFPDHAGYSDEELQALARRRDSSGVNTLLTTAKDFVKTQGRLTGVTPVGLRVILPEELLKWIKTRLK